MEKILSGMFLLNAYSLLLAYSNCTGSALPVKQVYVYLQLGKD